MRKTVLSTLAAAVGLLAAVPVAGAHIGTTPGEATAGSRAVIAFRVGHGCEDSPTTSLTIRIPAGVVFVTPEFVPGWNVAVKEGKLASPVVAEGETITEGVTEVTWTGGPLNPHEFMEFGISMLLPDTPGKALHFPTIQRCQKGQTAWVQLAAEGAPEPDRPAPAVQLTSAEPEPAPAPPPPPPAEDDLSGADMAALGMGGAGLLAGVTALVVATRRRSRS
jgi:periplasmic copper chaperone A